MLLLSSTRSWAWPSISRSDDPCWPTSRGACPDPAIKPIALLKTWQVYQEAGPHKVPIIGQGGITTADDALEFLIAGASAVGVGTALFYDPLVCTKINAGIADYLRRHGIANVGELVGTLATGTGAETRKIPARSRGCRLTV